MATSRRQGRRVTTVSPWIPGGEGELRDLFPLPPAVFLILRGIASSFRHYLITAVILVALYLWIAQDWSWWQAGIVFPLLFLLTRFTIITFWLWYRNPTVPLFARRP